MCRSFLKSFFVCLLVLTACSPRSFSWGQVVRTSSSQTEADSMAVHKKLESYTNEDIWQSLDWSSYLEQVTVTEKLSAPDSAGHQFVIERSTTTTTKRSESSAQETHTKEQQLQEETDSTSSYKAASLLIMEEKKTVSGDVKGWMPWYVYVVGLFFFTLLGALLGLGLLKRLRK